MNQIVYTFKINSEDMNQINYLYEIKKSIRYYLLKFLILFRIKLKSISIGSLRIILKVIKYAIPYILIRKMIPYSVKIRIKVLLSNYPTFTKVVKYILLWLKADKEKKSGHFLLFYKFLIKRLFIPIFKILLSNLEIREVAYIHLTRNNITPFDLNQKSKITDIFDNYKTIDEKFLMNIDLNLSLDVNEVYNQMKFFFISYNIQH